MNETSPICLIKFGSRENVESLAAKGKVHMETWEYFHKIEKDKARFDRDEGLLHLRQASNTQIYFQQETKWKQIQGLTGQITIHQNNLDDYNLFCMFALTEESFRHLTDPRISELGGWAAVVLKCDEFLARLGESLKKRNWSFSHGLVEYINRASYTGEVGPFKKLSCFAYQNEFRVRTNTQLKHCEDIYLGDLSSIISIVPCEEIEKRFMFNEQGCFMIH
jgi:hypothetical protein